MFVPTKSNFQSPRFLAEPDDDSSTCNNLHARTRQPTLSPGVQLLPRFSRPHLLCFQHFCKRVRNPFITGIFNSLSFQARAHSLAASHAFSTLLQNAPGGVYPLELSFLFSEGCGGPVCKKARNIRREHRSKTISTHALSAESLRQSDQKRFQFRGIVDGRLARRANADRCSADVGVKVGQSFGKRRRKRRSSRTVW